MTGQYDSFTIVEAPDDMAVTARALSFGKLGNVRNPNPTRFLSSRNEINYPQNGVDQTH